MIATMSDELAAAVLAGDLDRCRALLEGGADPRVATRSYPGAWMTYFDVGGAPLLHLAALTGNPAMVQLLIARGVDLDQTPTLESSYQTHDDTYEVRGHTAVSLAVNHGFVDVVRVLVEAGAELPSLQGRGVTRAQAPQRRAIAELLRAARRARRFVR